MPPHLLVLSLWLFQCSSFPSFSSRRISQPDSQQTIVPSADPSQMMFTVKKLKSCASTHLLLPPRAQTPANMTRNSWRIHELEEVSDVMKRRRQPVLPCAPRLNTRVENRNRFTAYRTKLTLIYESRRVATHHKNREHLSFS